MIKFFKSVKKKYLAPILSILQQNRYQFFLHWFQMDEQTHVTQTNKYELIGPFWLSRGSIKRLVTITDI